jgi:ABC-type polysaccharide/polyol phosphate transport system ATPase subunit
MDKVAISVRGVSKKYKLYHRRAKRLLDFLGVGLALGRHDEEICALKNVSFEVQRGTTVGIIGRNGAGKSTMLRILTGNTLPTTGEVEVKGKVSALLEIGTGFHPELTGRQNIYAGGVYLGMTREEIDRLYADIVAFSELEEFIHQPLKTYSSGMYMRLAFSVSTCINPDVLIIDEVLSVGDAYFSRKCFDRIRSFTEHGKTVVIVSHDLSMLQRFCGRLLWIDRGRLVMDGFPLDVLKAYAASIREQEEMRIRNMTPDSHHAINSLREKGLIYGSGEILITEVQCLNHVGREQHQYSAGEPFTIRMQYKTQVPVVDPVFVAAIYRIDGITVCQAISSRDGVRFDKLDGQGFVDVLFDRPLLGPGQYVVSVAIFPSLDLLDQLGQTPFDLHDRLYEFRIEPLVNCALDLGIVLHPVSWRHSRGE